MAPRPLHAPLFLTIAITLAGCTTPAQRRERALVDAIQAGDPAAVSRLLTEHGDASSSGESSGPLVAAAWSDAANAGTITRLLLDHGFRPVGTFEEFELLLVTPNGDAFDALLPTVSPDTLDLLLLELAWQREALRLEAIRG